MIVDFNFNFHIFLVLDKNYRRNIQSYCGIAFFKKMTNGPHFYHSSFYPMSVFVIYKVGRCQAKIAQVCSNNFPSIIVYFFREHDTICYNFHQRHGFMYIREILQLIPLLLKHKRILCQFLSYLHSICTFDKTYWSKYRK